MLQRCAWGILGWFLVTGVVTAADVYTVDPVHSSVLFRAKRFDVVNVYGRFKGLQGTLAVDLENPEQSSVELEVKAEAVDTANQRRDDHLRSPDFFNTAQFPVIRFKSSRIRKIAANRFEVSGELQLHGVTRQVVTEVELTGTGKDPRRGTPLIGFETSFTIRRSEFGMNFMVGPLSDEILLIVAVHGMGSS